MELLQSQIQRLNQQLLQSVEVLQMSSLELEQFLRDLAQENPLVELDEEQPAPERTQQDHELLRKLKWLEDNDRQNHFYQRVDEDEMDPLARVGNAGGLEETLNRFLSRQLDRMQLDETMDRTVRFLAACLDENGYFRLSSAELAEQTGLPEKDLAAGLDLLRTLEPAGVGAKDLSQCLELQLLRIGENGPALAIVRDHLEALAKCHYRAIAAKLSISLEEVQEAERIIRELEPRPGAIFDPVDRIAYINPDVFVAEENGVFTVRVRNQERKPFRIDNYYRDLLSQTEEKEVRDYLTAKLRQAENVLWSIGQRESTMKRCAEVIVARQQDFFRFGPQTLAHMRLADVAEELGVHESTVSRAVREKYLQCARGTYPLSYFFSRSATAGGGESAVGGTAARALLKQLIEEEDKKHPLSDQKLSEQMARRGCPISRRTVAKYREEMNIPGTSGRKE